MIVEAEELEVLHQKFASRGLPILEMNTKEVEKPEGAISFENSVGMAPAIYLDKIAAFPGVPRELYDMFPKFLSYFTQEKLETGNLHQRYYYLRNSGVTSGESGKRLFSGKGIFMNFSKNYGILIRMQTNASQKIKWKNQRKDI